MSRELDYNIAASLDAIESCDYETGLADVTGGWVAVGKRSKDRKLHITKAVTRVGAVVEFTKQVTLDTSVA